MAARKAPEIHILPLERCWPCGGVCRRAEIGDDQRKAPRSGPCFGRIPNRAASREAPDLTKRTGMVEAVRDAMRRVTLFE